MATIQLTQKPGNPASALRNAYQRLMGITDPDRLYHEALEVVIMAKGVSQKNVEKFKAAAKAALLDRRPLERLQGYINNYMLAADGLAVFQVNRGR